tara:strand:- start:213 stop:833 length:621 start_codon:yes stop_codon:yes gene_type:complete
MAYEEQQQEQDPQMVQVSYGTQMNPPVTDTNYANSTNDDCCDQAKQTFNELIWKRDLEEMRETIDNVEGSLREHGGLGGEMADVTIAIARGEPPPHNPNPEQIKIIHEYLDSRKKNIQNEYQERYARLESAVNRTDCEEFKATLKELVNRDAAGTPAASQALQEWLDCSGTDFEFGDSSGQPDFQMSSDKPINNAWAVLKIAEWFR